MKLGFIGFGGAGYGIAKGLRQAGLEEVHYHDRMQETPPYAEVIGRHAAEIGAIQAVTFGELLSRVEVVISCVTGAMAVSVADEAAPFLGPGHLYADVNTAAPRVKEEVVATLEELGVPAGMSRAAREKLLWCAGFGLRERFGGELPSTLTEVLQAMETPSGEK